MPEFDKVYRVDEIVADCVLLEQRALRGAAAIENFNPIGVVAVFVLQAGRIARQKFRNRDRFHGMDSWQKL